MNSPSSEFPCRIVPQPQRPAFVWHHSRTRSGRRSGTHISKREISMTLTRCFGLLFVMLVGMTALALDERISRELAGPGEMKKALATDRSDSGIRSEQGKRCLEARNDVQALFASARSATQSES